MVFSMVLGNSFLWVLGKSKIRNPLMIIGTPTMTIGNDFQ